MIIIKDYTHHTDLSKKKNQKLLIKSVLLLLLLSTSQVGVFVCVCAVSNYIKGTDQKKKKERKW
jgi:hypothetical protein